MMSLSFSLDMEEGDLLPIFPEFGIENRSPDVTKTAKAKESKGSKGSISKKDKKGKESKGDKSDKVRE